MEDYLGCDFHSSTMLKFWKGLVATANFRGSSCKKRIEMLATWMASMSKLERKIISQMGAVRLKKEE
eukprot:974279-Heterocapsa_arctica.AAC.1